MRRLTLEQANVKHLGAIARFVDEVCAGCITDEGLLYKVKMAVDEACTNVLEHAYEGEEGRLEVHAQCTPSRLNIEIRDWGKAFDPTIIPVPDPSLPVEQRPVGGLGIYLMRKLMDRVEYRFDGQAGNCLTLEKRLDTGYGM